MPGLITLIRCEYARRLLCGLDFEPQSGNTALIYASWNGQLSVAEILLKSGADHSLQTSVSINERRIYDAHVWMHVYRVGGLLSMRSAAE